MDKTERKFDRLKKSELLDALKEWRDRLVEMNRASGSADYWSEEEYGDQTKYIEIRALLSQPAPEPPSVSRETVEKIVRLIDDSGEWDDGREKIIALLAGHGITVEGERA